MAGMDGGAAPRGHDKKKKKHKRMRRLNVRIDMTPMVDVAFLLEQNQYNGETYVELTLADLRRSESA